MNTSEQILVIALGIMLAIFLLLSILVLAQALKLITNLRHISEKVEKVVDSAEAVGDVLRSSTNPIGLFRFVRSVAETAMEHKQERRHK